MSIGVVQTLINCVLQKTRQILIRHVVRACVLCVLSSRNSHHKYPSLACGCVERRPCLNLNPNPILKQLAHGFLGTASCSSHWAGQIKCSFFAQNTQNLPTHGGHILLQANLLSGSRWQSLFQILISSSFKQ